MGTRAEKAAEEIAKLQNDGNFNTISDPAPPPPPPPSMGFTSHRSTMDIESRKRIEEDIIKSLNKSSVGMIGICGIGGVGKTTMAQRIRKRVKEENLFDEVVMVIASKQKDILGIQEEIAYWLRLQFDERTMSARADKLRMRLMDKNRKIIIFDDVWERLKLEELGVPFESGFERCKILLTTRSKDVCEKMEVQKIIAMEILTEEEAWILFKEKAGNCVEDPTLLSLAKDVVAECKGLPIALVTVGKALQNREKSIWVDSLSQMRRSNPVDFSEVLEDVYKPLKLSYDHLESESEKLLFLLCCLFPEDYNIPVEQLTWYSMGLRLFDDTTSIAEARNRTRSVVDRLKSRFLLMDAYEEYPIIKYGFYVQPDELHVKIHDVVRDMAIHIVSGEKGGFIKILKKTSMEVDSPRETSSDVDCNWMSVDISNEQMEVPVGLRFPKLRLLMLLKLSSNEFSDISFEGMEDLNVLFLSGFSFGSTPPVLKSLRTLYFYSCTVENISVIGELTGLEIFSCYRCCNIKELPAEIGKLNRLRFLELCYCQRLRTIPFGIISSFVRLEELKIVDSFWRWEAEKNGKQRRNASLTELESLPNLTCLQIEIDDWNLAAQDLRLSQNLVKFCILIAPDDYWFEERDYEKVMNLNLPSHIGDAVGKWIQILVRYTEYLCLQGEGSNNFNIAECENLRNLRVWNCSMFKKLVETKDSKSGIVFPLLETLRLEALENLEEICDCTIILNQNISLFNLKSILILECYNLRYLFSVSMARRCLLQLEDLSIESCYAMEQVFWNEITDNTDSCIEFPKLKTLRLVDLPNLTAFCQGSQTIKFPELTEMEIRDLPKLNSLSPLNSETPHHDRTSFHFLCNPKVEIGGLKILKLFKLGDNIRNIWCDQIPINFFNNLQALSILDLNGIRSLMSYSIAKNLVSLKSLYIGRCQEMVEVIEGDDKEVLVDIKCLFPTLKKLSIYKLPKLRRFWLWNLSLELPLLEYVSISYCPVMETFTFGSLNTPNIWRINMQYHDMDDKKDLNHVIYQYHGILRLGKNKNVDKNKDENKNRDNNMGKDKNKDEDEKENMDKDEDENENEKRDKDENENENKDKDKGVDENVNEKRDKDKNEKEDKDKDVDENVNVNKKRDKDENENKDKDKDVDEHLNEKRDKDEDENKDKDVDKDVNEKRDKYENENKDKDVDQNEDMDQYEDEDDDEDEAWMMPYIISGLRVRRSTRTRWTTWI